MWQRIAAFLVGILFAVNTLAQLPAQKDEANGVTIAVTPVNLAPAAKTWDFTIAFDTHSGSLSDDVAKSAVLADDSGKEFKPLGWAGAAPGGHHRQGVLKFAPISPRPQAIELRITRSSEQTPRRFRWNLN